ncbi:hypothetical protein SARC_12651 [Sphaeroforma arctica JP610]|uniref:LSM domain-containing protein n=1 Tax=Sphaeroforma arctica JP610 TaxID=667725 RepID=A0A0L0FDH4_9EUKA|nr:hypothetical protein SARC_12651 [Sphaeroforma arctica JP610]KNC74810.1 hypothetical protein SARC_12651 [Sphaeroforma arctica JP610]|eukprot:XP_014148712.1 hypothetical protein SARC_12651 [Sphaeroforma arctica JP610]
MQMQSITVTARNGQVSKMEYAYLRGSKVRYFIIPDMLKNAPFFNKGKSDIATGKTAVLRGQVSSAASESSVMVSMVRTFGTGIVKLVILEDFLLIPEPPRAFHWYFAVHPFIYYTDYEPKAVQHVHYDGSMVITTPFSNSNFDLSRTLKAVKARQISRCLDNTAPMKHERASLATTPMAAKILTTTSMADRSQYSITSSETDHLYFTESLPTSNNAPNTSNVDVMVTA